MSRGFHPFRERRATLLLLALLSIGFRVLQPDQSPVPGAWIGTSDEWIGASDASGFFEFSGNPPDTVRIHATGFAEWSGPPPEPGGVVVLTPVVLDSGQSITVLATRGSLADRLPSTMVVQDAELHRLSSLGMERLTSSSPGVSVREYGGSIPVVSVSLRGGDPSQVDYMVDGVSIVSARDGMPTGVFDPAVFSSLEIARGGAVPGAGGTGSSGALNWLPPLGNRPLKLLFSGFSDGSFGVASRFSRTGVSLRRTVGTEGSAGFSTSMVSTFSADELSGGVLAGWADGDTESPEWTLDADGRRKQMQVEGWLNWAHDQLEFDLSSGSGYMEYSQTEPSVMEDSHEDASGRMAASWKGPVTMGASYSASRVTSTSTGDHFLGFFSLEAEYGYGAFSIFTGCRLDDRGAEPSGRLNLHGALPVSGVKGHLSLFTDHRSPTVNDLYWPNDGMTAGNPDLLSERTTGAEAGADWKGSSLSGAVCFFAASTSDLIIWLPDDNGIWAPSNISSSLSRGVETQGKIQLDDLSLSGTFTWNLAEDRTEGTPRFGMLIPYRPEYTWSAGAILNFPGDARLEGTLYGTGKRFTNRTQTEYLDEYFLLDLSASASITGNLTVILSAGNLMDKDYFSSSGYPGRGRTAGLTLEYTGN